MKKIPVQLDQKLAVIVQLTKLLRDEEHETLDIFTEFNAIASDITNSERSSLYLSNQTQTKLITKVAQGLKENIEIAFGEGIAGQCALLKKSIIENRVQTNGHFNQEIDKRSGFTTYKTLAVPILSKNKKVLGVIQVLNKINGEYRSDDKDLLILIAELIVSVIENLNLKRLLQEEVDTKTKELQELNQSLHEEVERQVEAHRKKDAIMFHQSQLASMGEMIDAVAHQWKQPLDIISLYMIQLEMSLSHELDSDALAHTAQHVNEQILHLSNTLTDFRSFFRRDTTTQTFLLKDAIDSVLKLLEKDLDRYDLHITTALLEDILLDGSANEFKHVLINLINNAKDAFIEADIKMRNIRIETFNEKNSYIIHIKDNAGGIPKEITDHLFEANVSSKVQKGGTGIGLYMSKMIIEKMRGTIEAREIEKGTLFIITLPKVEKNGL